VEDVGLHEGLQLGVLQDDVLPGNLLGLVALGRADGGLGPGADGREARNGEVGDREDGHSRDTQ
jgi:hypothetical protein